MQPEPVGSFPTAASVYGMIEAAGNSWDWTSSLFEPHAQASSSRVLPGGSWFPTVGDARAAEDIAESATTIAADDPGAALRFIDAVQRECAALVMFPRLGRARGFRSAGLEAVRSRPVSGLRSWLLFYRVLPDAIDVLRVLHGARDLPAVLGDAREG